MDGPGEVNVLDSSSRHPSATFAKIYKHRFINLDEETISWKYSALDEEGEGLETLDIELPARSRRMSIPPEFLALSPVGEFKFEVIATEDSGNQTIFEDEFSLEDDEDDKEDP